jgi:hypothetical protein
MRFVNNWLSLAGVVLVTTAGVLWLLLLPAEFSGEAPNPYGGLVWAGLLVLFLLGLAAIPLGLRLFSKAEEVKAVLKKLWMVIGLTTAANLVIGSHLTYATVEHMDTPDFCGVTCHVMNPEFNAWKVASHSHVKCVSCHITPGAQGYISAKTNGARQMVLFLAGNYSKPIPTPVHNLPTAQTMCGSCHDPEANHPDKLKIFRHYDDDEANTLKYSVFLMRNGATHAAHRNLQVSWKDAAKTEVAALGSGETMTCLDCHNRPAHSYETPSAAVERALASGLLSQKLPFVKKHAMELLTAKYTSSAAAKAAIAAGLREAVPGAGENDVRAVQTLYEQNVSPEMNLVWNAYPNHLGHNDSPGCFRCHDDERKSPAGKVITQDCEACHSMVSSDEAKPKILEDLGWRPR